MPRFRSFLLVTAVALCGAQACSSGTDLNPQPLPPVAEPGRAPEDRGEFGNNGAGSNGDGTSAATSGDGGAEGGDAADAGDH